MPPSDWDEYIHVLEQVARSLLAKLIAAVPGWLLRWIMKPQNLSSKLKLDLRGNAPGGVSDSGAVPQLELWLRATNHSAFPVALDRVALEVWFGQPFARTAVLERKDIPPHSDVEDLRVAIFLSETQVAYLRREVKTPLWKPEITLQAIAYFTSKLGWTTLGATIRRQDFPVSLKT